MPLSAIIPTHNRADVLRRCLETLGVQEVAPSAFEVVVVDDGSEMDIARLVDEVAQAGSIQMRCERQELTGLNAARNRGVAVATGELLAFLDDDTLVSPGWAAALLAAFAAQPCAAIGGKVELSLAGPAPPWLAERSYYLAEYDLGRDARWIVGDDPVPVGANCAVRRKEFDRVGGFRPGLDRIGRSLVSNGDTDFFRRLRDLGGRMRYEPDALVAHCVPADRLTVRYFTKRHYAQGVSDELLRLEDGERFSWGEWLNFARLTSRGLKMLCDDVLHRRGSVNGRFEAGYWAGRFTGYGRRLGGVMRSR